MKQSFLMIAAVAAVAATVFSGETLSAPPNGLVAVKVEGELGTVLRMRILDPDAPVSASVIAGGGELFLDTRHSKTASDMLTKWYDGRPVLLSVIPKPPRVKITGRLEYRVLKGDDPNAMCLVGADFEIMLGHQSGWVLVVDKLELMDQ